MLRSGEPAMLFLGGDALRAKPLADAHRIAAATRTRVMAETFCARMERGRGRFPIERLPYYVEPGLAAGMSRSMVTAQVPAEVAG